MPSKDYNENFVTRLQDAIQATLGARVEIQRWNIGVGCTVEDLEPGLEIEVWAPRQGVVYWMTVAPKARLPWGETLKKEIRSKDRYTEVDLDRVVKAVVELRESLLPWYRLRRAVKSMVWSTLGLTMTADDWQEFMCRGKTMIAGLQWAHDWHQGREQGCVEVVVRASVEAWQNRSRALTLRYFLDTPVDQAEFTRQLNLTVEKWRQEDQQATAAQDRLAANEQIVSKLRQDYPLDEVALEGTEQGIKITLRVQTEQEARALLAWCAGWK